MRLPRKGPTPPASPLGIEASQWLLSLLDRNPAPADPHFDRRAHSAAFNEWVTQSVQHTAVFLRVCDSYQKAGSLDSHHRIRIEALLTEYALCRATRGDSKVRGLSSLNANCRSFKWAAAALLATVLSLISSRSPVGHRPGDELSMHYSTAIGEHRMIELADGSKMTLNTNSHVLVSFGAQTRFVRLLNGEALFKIQHDSSRPFFVESDDLHITDVGTEFDVYYKPGDTRVSVIDGQVRLDCACGALNDLGASRQPTTNHHPPSELLNVHLSGGDQVTITRQQGVVRLERRHKSAEDLARTLAWQDGRLFFKGESLAEVVEELNRYNTQHLVIADSVLAQFHVGGFVHSTDVATFLEILRVQWGIRASGDPNNPNVIRLERSR
jgi:transmembrane sensor